MLFNVDELTRKIEDGFKCLNVPFIVANYSIESLLISEMCGDSTHGLSILNEHVKKIKRGLYNYQNEPSALRETSAFAVLNCNNNIGMYSARYCMDYAMTMAKKNGIFTVFANNCNTYSAAFVYTWQAARQGLIGYTMCNTPAQMAPIGGIKRLLGTNPFSYAIPAKNEYPIIFDAATSVVSKSRISAASKKGEMIPEGWGLDADGNPTTDPSKIVKGGSVLPMAGPKGFGLSMMIDIFAGLLGGAGYLDSVNFFHNEKKECMNVGQVFVAIEPKIVYGNEFFDKVDDYIQKIRNSSSCGMVRLPGHTKIKNYEKALANGIDVDENIIKEFEALCNE